MKRNTGPNALRRGRASVAHLSYFATLCVEDRRSVLAGAIGDSLLSEARAMEAESIWMLRCATIMPDHMHLFFQLGERLALSQTIARLKARSRPLLQTRGARWQDNFYDHRLRSDDSVEAVFRYIYLNPYQAGLISTKEQWAHFYCRFDDWEWFKGLTDSGQPFPEWLK